MSENEHGGAASNDVPEGSAPHGPEHQHAAQQDPASSSPATQAPADAQEWIRVAPENPYVTGASSTRPPAGRGLAITAMAIGLVAALTAAVSAFYFSAFVLAGALLGAVAIVIGIIALVRRQRPLGAGITGLVAGGLAIVLALGVGALSLGALLLPAGAGSASGGSGDSAPAPAPEGAPEDDAPFLEWPANMATGGIIFGPGGDPLTSDPLQPGSVPPRAEVARDGTRNDVLVYVDYRCPHCSSFEQANQELLAELVASDDTTVEIVPLSFLDRASEGAYYSSRAAAVMACVVDIQPVHAWQVHSNLLDPRVQPGAGPGLTNDQLVQLVEVSTNAALDPVEPLDPAVAECITSERFVPFAKALNDWVFSNPVPNADDPDLRVQGTPLAVVNGVPYPGDPADGAAFRAFVDEQTR